MQLFFIHHFQLLPPEFQPEPVSVPDLIILAQHCTLRPGKIPRENPANSIFVFLLWAA
jgi:hypothetical protein